jgi:F-type H+-transporting ATPase subunit b
MKKLLCLIALGVAISFFSVAAMAQTEHSEAAESHHEESAFQIIARWANFAVLFGGLAYLLRRPMVEFFQNRRNEIKTGLQRAQDAQKTAESRMEEIERRLAHLAADVAALQEEAEKESLSDREQILAEARREVARVIEQSSQEIDRVAKALEHQIKEDLADLVIDRAGNTLRTEMTQDDQKRVIVRFIQKL